MQGHDSQLLLFASGLWCGMLSELVWLCMLRCYDIPFRPQEPEALKHLLNSLEVKVVELLPPFDNLCIDVKAWRKDLCIVPKVCDIEVLQPIMQNSVPLPADSHDNQSL